MFAAPTRSAENAAQSPLEREFIAEYLAARGYLLKDLKTLPNKMAYELMAAACQYASLRLAEIESRANFVRKI
jgi:hypothetical protein